MLILPHLGREEVVPVRGLCKNTSSPKSCHKTLHLLLGQVPIPKPNTVMERWDRADELRATYGPRQPDTVTRSPEAHWVGIGNVYMRNVYLPKDGEMVIRKTLQHPLYFQDSTGTKVVHSHSRDYHSVDYSMKAYPSPIPT